MLRYLPITHWLSHYNITLFRQDFLAAIVVTLMLVPQSLSYALLAGVPPYIGLYSSIAPLLLYALFGSSRTLSVGPIAITSLMTASIASSYADPNSADYLTTVILLALLSGIILIIMSSLRLGFLANFLSNPVNIGFTTASAIIIIFSQIKHLLGIQAQGDNLYDLIVSLYADLQHINWITFCLSLIGFGLLYSIKHFSRYISNNTLSQSLRRFSPVIVIALLSFFIWYWQLFFQNTKIVGEIPSKFDFIHWNSISLEKLNALLPGAFLISLVSFASSISIGKLLATKKHEQIKANQELFGLGIANIGVALSGGMPVTGGFSRSVVNEEAGAQTQLASIFTAFGTLMTILWFSDFLYYMPLSILSVTIIIAVIPMIDYSALKQAFRYDKLEGLVMLTTIILTLIKGMEIGLATGMLISLAAYIYRTIQPKISQINQNDISYKQYDCCKEECVILKIEGNLYFANIDYIENKINTILNKDKKIVCFILDLSQVNYLDLSCLKSLISINSQMNKINKKLYLININSQIYSHFRKIEYAYLINKKNTENKNHTGV
ncbi:sodium-independent anion transporter [Pasteurella canis]|uniref:SulP family inorganic anion transporter n=1 Tax=Pasteurella canis TaxID=753 RepID=UPI001E46815C|nr:SulP family inorganic anion transporter [Pasteurella canis]GJJ80084.1 sodium-independent anion transporter [Pasteurella canis]